jgi:O-antigen/teichoic acid export membrane protein
MSRFRKYVHSLISGYALLGANIVYTLASIPLALHYLSREQFGLWSLVTQVCNFNALLIDFGLAGSVARILVDHKDDEGSTNYGAVIKTSALVLAIQGLFIAIAGIALGWWLPGWVDVPEKFTRVLGLLVMGQCLVLAGMLAMRIFAFILQAHQRYDICNYSLLAGLVVSLVVLWAGFEFGLGLFSLLAAAAVSALVSSVLCWWAVRHLELLPAQGRWGRVNRVTFNELFLYGTDLFLLSVGCQLIGACQVPVITRALGAEAGLVAAAVWSIATKSFFVVQQLVSRILDFSSAALSEMMARGERDRLLARYRDIVILTGSACVAVGLIAALCNQTFLQIWTRNRISWDVRNDFLMAVSLIVFCSTRCHIGFVGLTKRVGTMKYIYLAEAVLFVTSSYLAVRHFGLTGMIVSGIVTNFLFSGVFGLRRTMQFFGIHSGEVLRWIWPSARLFALLLALALGIRFFTAQISSAVVRFLVEASGMSAAAGLGLWFLGLPHSLRAEVKGRFQSWLHRRRTAS